MWAHLGCPAVTTWSISFKLTGLCLPLQEIEALDEEASSRQEASRQLEAELASLHDSDMLVLAGWCCCMARAGGVGGWCSLVKWLVLQPESDVLWLAGQSAIPLPAD